MRQGSLFDLLPPNQPDEIIGLVGVMPAVRAAMNRVAGEYKDGRKMLVDAINKVARQECVALTRNGGKGITEDQLNKFLQPGEQGHEPDIRLVLCFCKATGDYTPLAPLWKPFGLVVIPAADLPLLEYGKTCDALKKAREHKKKLEARL
jgi:hypothetical protein